MFVYFIKMSHFNKFTLIDIKSINRIKSLNWSDLSVNLKLDHKMKS